MANDGGRVMTRQRPDAEKETRRCERRAVFSRTVERLMDRLYGTALRLTRNPDDAEDIVAETVVRAWSKLDDLHDSDRLEAWLFHILNNTFVSEWRRRQCRQRLDGEPSASDPDEAGALTYSLFEQLHQPFLLWWGNAEEQFLNALLQEELEAALDALPDVFRVVVVMVEVEGYTYSETAKLLGIPPGTVRSRISRGRGLLQRALWNQGVAAGLVTPGDGMAERGERS
jgi:RNA polymerase sigma-70 factor (ECF subfamily)